MPSRFAAFSLCISGVDVLAWHVMVIARVRVRVRVRAMMMLILMTSVMVRNICMLIVWVCVGHCEYKTISHPHLITCMCIRFPPAVSLE